MLYLRKFVLLIYIILFLISCNSYLFSSTPILKLSVSGAAPIGSDAIVLYFANGATEYYDSEFDSYHKPNTDPNLPNFYSIVPGEKLINNGMPPLTKDRFVSLGLTFSKLAALSITATSIAGFPGGTKIYLIDSLTLNVQELTANPLYSFTYKTTDPEKRFYICIDIPLSDDPTSAFITPSVVKINEIFTLTYTGNASSTAIFLWNFDGADIISGSDAGPYQLKWTTKGNKYISLTVKELCCKTSPETSQKVTVTGFYKISGILSYSNSVNTPLSDFYITLISSDTIFLDTSITNTNGYYEFNNVANGNYKLKLSTNSEWQAVDPGDALFVNRTYIGATLINDKLREIAADVNVDNSIDPGDALLINRRYIGAIPRFPSPDWLFDSPDIIVNDIDVLQNIKAICAGDVNGSF